jgi:hypothetical protein
MLHRDKYSIEVTDDDIDRAMTQERYNPLQLAISRITGKAPEEIDVRRYGVFISVYEYADFLKYTFDDDCLETIKDELAAWEDWHNGPDLDTALYMEPFTCNLTLERSF